MSIKSLCETYELFMFHSFEKARAFFASEVGSSSATDFLYLETQIVGSFSYLKKGKIPTDFKARVKRMKLIADDIDSILIKYDLSNDSTNYLCALKLSFVFLAEFSEFCEDGQEIEANMLVSG